MLITFMAFASCKVYVPQTVSIPLMSAKHELQLSGGITVPPAITGSVAFSPFSHIALQAHGFLAPQGSAYYQGMIGYYWKNQQSLNFEVYGGLAKGEGKAMKVSGSPSLNGNYSVYFTQLNIGQNGVGSRNLDYGIGLKAGIFSIKVIDNGYYENMELDPIHYKNKYYLVEPMAFLRIGKDPIRIGMQVNGVALISALSKQGQIPYHTIALGVSVNYRILKISE
jgi:hypothetical protein